MALPCHLHELPIELARLVKTFLTLDEVIVLCGSGSAAAATRLHHFLPSESELDDHVPDSVMCLKSDKKHRQRRRHHQMVSRCSPSIQQATCPYHNECLRRLLLHCDAYTTLARRKLAATEALTHLHDEYPARQAVALEILKSHKSYNHLNRVALATTLAVALRHSCHAVVAWIVHEPDLVALLPRRHWVDVLRACCEYEYDDDCAGTTAALSLVQSMVPSLLIEARGSWDGCRATLISAARHGRLAIVERILESLVATATPRTAVDKTLQDALEAAATGGHLHVAVALLHAAALFHPPLVLDVTEALCRACRGGYQAIVQLLLTCSHLIQNSSTHRPLYAAVESDNTNESGGGGNSIVDCILADPRVNQWDPLAFHRAACDGKISIVKKLLSHPGCRPKDLDVALRSATRCPQQQQQQQQHAKSLGNVKLVVLELVGRLQENAFTDAGSCWELVDSACCFGDVDVLDLVLARLITPQNLGDRIYWRPLVTAARCGHVAIVKRILETDAKWLTSAMNPNPPPLEGNTNDTATDTEAAEALLAACHRDHLATAQLLLPYVGVDLMRLLRIVEAAAAAPTSTVLEWLLTTQQEITTTACDLDAALQYACANGRVAAVKLLLRDPRVRFADGVALQFAATSGDVALVKLLLANTRVNDSYDLEAALVDASREGHVAVVACLLADPRLRITSGAAFHEACHRGRLPVVVLLMGADVMWREPQLLHLDVAFQGASQRGHYEIVFLLLNDPRVLLPRGGALMRLDVLPRRPGDASWCKFLRRFFRHPRIDPCANGNQLLLEASRHARRGVVTSLLRSGRCAMGAKETSTAISISVEENRRLAEIRSQHKLERRYLEIAKQLHEYAKDLVAS